MNLFQLSLRTALLLVSMVWVSLVSADQIDEASKTQQTADIEQRVAVVNNYVKALNTKDISIIKAMYAPNATVHDPLGTEPKSGFDAVVKFYAEGAFNKQAQLSAELTGPVRVAGNSAAFSFNVFFNGLKLEVIDVFEFNKEGKVEVMRAYWSNANISPITEVKP